MIKLIILISLNVTNYFPLMLKKNFYLQVVFQMIQVINHLFLQLKKIACTSFISL